MRPANRPKAAIHAAAVNVRIAVVPRASAGARGNCVQGLRVSLRQISALSIRNIFRGVRRCEIAYRQRTAIKSSVGGRDRENHRTFQAKGDESRSRERQGERNSTERAECGEKSANDAGHESEDAGCQQCWRQQKSKCVHKCGDEIGHSPPNPTMTLSD